MKGWRKEFTERGDKQKSCYRSKVEIAKMRRGKEKLKSMYSNCYRAERYGTESSRMSGRVKLLRTHRFKQRKKKDQRRGRWQGRKPAGKKTRNLHKNEELWKRPEGHDDIYQSANEKKRGEKVYTSFLRSIHLHENEWGIDFVFM